MKIAIAQLNYIVGNFEHNKFKIIDAISQAKQEGADLVVFAESAISGAPAYSLLARYNFLDKAEETLVEIAAFCDDIAVLVGMPVMQDGGTYSAAAYIKNRKILRYITKKNKVSDVDAAYIGDALADFTPIAEASLPEGRTELHYELTTAQYEMLLEALADRDELPAEEEFETDSDLVLVIVR